MIAAPLRKKNHAGQRPCTWKHTCQQLKLQVQLSIMSLGMKVGVREGHRGVVARGFGVVVFRTGGVASPQWYMLVNAAAVMIYVW